MNNSATRPAQAIAIPAFGVHLGELKNFIIIALLIGLVMTSGLSLVYVKHHNRELFAQYGLLKRQHRQAQVEWDRLLLEQGALSTQSRVQQVAMNRLHMQQPMHGKVMHVSR